MLHLIAIAALAVSALAESDPGSAPADADPIVCKKSKVSVVGTRMKSPPVCKPKSEWNREDKDMKHEMRQIMERATNPTPIPGGPR